MIIDRNALLVGSLGNADPNSHSYQNQEWQRRRRQNQPPAEEASEACLLTHAGRQQLDSPASEIGSAISLGQTQDAFLQKVEQALQRMDELSTLAQNSDAKDANLLYTDEFNQLQSQIRDIRRKMFEAAGFFHATTIDSLPSAADASAQTADVTLNDSLQNTFDPCLTGIHTAISASAANDSIKSARQKVAEARTRVTLELEKLHFSLKQTQTDSADDPNAKIADTLVAEESTRIARYNILVQSGTAMLAQANALPHSALRLLR